MKEKTTPLQKALNLWAIILIVWAFYRSYLKLPIWFDELIAKPLIFVAPVFYFIKKIDKKKIRDYFYLKFKTKEVLEDVLYSMGLGIVLVLTAIAASYYKNGKLIFFGKFPDLPSVFWIIILGLATGITEEILSRGFVLRKLYDESKNALSSTFFSSILFFFLHVPILFNNPKVNGNMLLVFMVTDLLLSMLNGLIFIQRKSLLVPIMIHAFYNIVLSLTLI